ncbi:hypothetical protein HK104_003023 [Borealophlyctis nickersoniae]|nr:hypothetical protein HK104_003023 [Borealophlyctis nickersoniae]
MLPPATFTFQCPVKNCGQRFAVRSNCTAHGRTRHNRVYQPLVLDVSQDASAILERLGCEENEGTEAGVTVVSPSCAPASAPGGTYYHPHYHQQHHHYQPSHQYVPPMHAVIPSVFRPNSMFSVPIPTFNSAPHDVHPTSRSQGTETTGHHSDISANTSNEIRCARHVDHNEPPEPASSNEFPLSTSSPETVSASESFSTTPVTPMGSTPSEQPSAPAPAPEQQPLQNNRKRKACPTEPTAERKKRNVRRKANARHSKEPTPQTSKTSPKPQTKEAALQKDIRQFEEHKRRLQKYQLFMNQCANELRELRSRQEAFLRPQTESSEDRAAFDTRARELEQTLEMLRFRVENAEVMRAKAVGGLRILLAMEQRRGAETRDNTAAM